MPEKAEESKEEKTSKEDETSKEAEKKKKKREKANEDKNAEKTSTEDETSKKAVKKKKDDDEGKVSKRKKVANVEKEKRKSGGPTGLSPEKKRMRPEVDDELSGSDGEFSAAEAGFFFDRLYPPILELAHTSLAPDQICDVCL